MRGSLFLTALLAALIHSAPAQAAPVAAPYSIDFSQFSPGDSIPNLTASPSAAWSITPDHRYRVSVSFSPDPFTPPAMATSMLNVTNLSGRDFEFSTRLTPTAIPSSGTGVIGLAAFADSAGIVSNLNAGYELALVLASPTVPVGTLHLREYTPNPAPSVVSSQSLPITLGATYDLTLRGDFHDGILDLLATASDGQRTISLSTTDPTPRTGSNFGLWTIASGSTGSGATVAANFSHLTVVPEPAGLALLSFPLWLLRRRR